MGILHGAFPVSSLKLYSFSFDVVSPFAISVLGFSGNSILILFHITGWVSICFLLLDPLFKLLISGDLHLLSLNTAPAMSICPDLSLSSEMEVNRTDVDAKLARFAWLRLWGSSWTWYYRLIMLIKLMFCFFCQQSVLSLVHITLQWAICNKVDRNSDEFAAWFLCDCFDWQAF